MSFSHFTILVCEECPGKTRWPAIQRQKTPTGDKGSKLNSISTSELSELDEAGDLDPRTITNCWPIHFHLCPVACGLLVLKDVQ